MATKIQHKRSNNVATSFPALAPGELAFNGPQQKIAMGDPITGLPIELLAVRFFSTASSYATNDFVTNAGTLLRAIHPVSPGIFNAADWAGAAAGVPEAPIDGTPYFRQSAGWVSATLANLGGVAEAPNDGKAYSRKSTVWAQLNALDVVYGATTVSAALDVKIDMTALTSDNITNTSGLTGADVSDTLNFLNTQIGFKAPLNNPHFTGLPQVPTPNPGDNSLLIPNTTWVNTALTGKPNIVISDSVPSAPADNTLWWESDTGYFHIRYNDGNSSQWVQLNPAPNLANYVAKTGDTMTGQLTTTAIQVNAANPWLMLQKATAAGYNTIQGNNGANARWQMVLGNGAAEGGSNAGSDFVLNSFDDTGNYIATPLNINRATGAVAIKGVTDGSNALTGQVGEYITASRLSGSPLALTTVVPANVTSISLTAGDWDICGNVGYVVAAGTITTAIYASLNSVSATFPAPHLYSTVFLSGAAGTNNGVTLQPPPQRFSFAATTTLYLLAQAAFSGGTCSAYGFIAARRMR